MGAGHPEGWYVFCHPSEVGAEAVGALSARRPGGFGDAARGWVRFGQEGGQEQHRGAAGNTGGLMWGAAK